MSLATKRQERFAGRCVSGVEDKRTLSTGALYMRCKRKLGDLVSTAVFVALIDSKAESFPACTANAEDASDPALAVCRSLRKL